MSPGEVSTQPVDPDIDLRDRAQQRELSTHPVTVLATISIGGILGSLARYGLGELLPHDAGAWSWATLLVNTSGCLLIGSGALPGCCW